MQRFIETRPLLSEVQRGQIGCAHLAKETIEYKVQLLQWLYGKLPRYLRMPMRQAADEGVKQARELHSRIRQASLICGGASWSLVVYRVGVSVSRLRPFTTGLGRHQIRGALVAAAVQQAAVVLAHAHAERC